MRHTTCGASSSSSTGGRRQRRREPQQLPLAPEIGQRRHDVHGPESPGGGAARGEVGRAAERLGAERGGDLGGEPCASAVPTSPLRTSPLPPVASPGLPAATVSGGRPAARDHRGHALEQHASRPTRRPPATAAAQGSSSRTGASVGKERAELARDAA